ncbi:MAG: alpha/beta hydrolase, partial [Actinomycetota bacterium]
SGPGPVADPRAGLRRSERLRAGEAEQVAAEMGDMISHMDGPNGPAARDAFIEMCATVGPGVMTRQSDALAKRGDLRPRLGEITCPALVVHGTEDTAIPMEDAEAMAAGLVGCGGVVKVGGAHAANLTNPEPVNAAILEFLADLHS